MPCVKRLGRADRLAGDAQFEQLAPRDRAQHEGQDHHRKNADARFRHAEPRVIGDDREVAGADQAEAAGKRMAVDARDHRHAGIDDGAEQFHGRIVALGRIDA